MRRLLATTLVAVTCASAVPVRSKDDWRRPAREQGIVFNPQTDQIIPSQCNGDDCLIPSLSPSDPSWGRSLNETALRQANAAKFVDTERGGPSEGRRSWWLRLKQDSKVAIRRVFINDGPGAPINAAALLEQQGIERLPFNISYYASPDLLLTGLSGLNSVNKSLSHDTLIHDPSDWWLERWDPEWLQDPNPGLKRLINNAENGILGDARLLSLRETALSSQGRDVYDCEWTEIMTREEGADLESLLLKTRWQTVRVAKTLYWAMTTGDSSDGTQMRIMSEESFHETESFDYGTNETAAYAGLFVDQIHLAVERCLYAALKRNETGFKNDRNL